MAYDKSNSRSTKSRITGRFESSAKQSRDNSSDDLRTDGRIESSIDGENKSVGDGARNNEFNAETDERANRSFKLQDGYYFSPSGSVERIPSGYYLKPDGRLAKRRKRRGSNVESANGNENTDRTNSSEKEIYDSETPIRVGQVRRTKKAKLTETQQRLTLLAMLGVALTALFSSASLFFGKHWQLESEETSILADALNEALKTLPDKHYATILAIIEKHVPWINLVFVCSAVIWPRIEYSLKSPESRNKENNLRDDFGIPGERAKNYNGSDKSSLGWNE